MEVGLVSCTDAKRTEPSRPSELYDESALFRKASAYAGRNYDEWFVVSAKHGLLEPDGPRVEPYDVTLSDLDAEERRAWAADVAADLRERLPASATIELHAGAAYAEPLVPELDEFTCEVPLDGLRIGERLAWYNDRLEGSA